ncbi:MAG: hypothetical protein ACFBWO_09535 [Paracoccaceae bacterium]
MRTLLTTTACALMLTSGLALAQTTDEDGTMASPQDPNYESAADFDTDGDGMVSQDEFTENFDADASFARFDYDEDGTITPDEYTRAMYEAHDLDRDGEWSAEEASAYDRAQAGMRGEDGPLGGDSDLTREQSGGAGADPSQPGASETGLSEDNREQN